MGDDVGGSHGSPRFFHDNRLDRLAPCVIRYADDSHVHNRRVAENRVLDFGRIDVLATRHDHVFHAVVNVEVTV